MIQKFSLYYSAKISIEELFIMIFKRLVQILPKFPQVLKNRMIGGQVNMLLLTDIKSIFKSGKITTRGIAWFFGGGAAYTKCLVKDNFNEQENCLCFDNIRLPSIAVSEYNDLLAIYVDHTYSREIVEKLYDEGPYEYKEVFVEKGDIVIDAGAHMGVFSAYCSSRGGVVYAFEPAPDTIEILKITANLNKDIHIIPEVLSDTVGSIEMNLCGILSRANSIVNETKNSQKMTINTTTLDDFVHTNNIKRVDFIKADIEGAERLLLRGAKNVLKDFAPKLAICKYHLPDDRQVIHDLIMEANSNYIIRDKWKKMFAHVAK